MYSKEKKELHDFTGLTRKQNQQIATLQIKKGIKTRRIPEKLMALSCVELQKSRVHTLKSAQV